MNITKKKKLQELPGEEIESITIDKVPTGVSNALFIKIYQKSQMETGGLAYKLKFKVHAKVMITANIDVEDKICNGQIGMIEHIKYDDIGRIKKIYLKMEDTNIGIKMMNSDNYGRLHSLVPIEMIEKEFQINKNRASSPSIKRLQFPLVLSWAYTVHKVQGKTFQEIVFSFNLMKQKRFNSGQVYVGISRVTTLSGLYLTGLLNKNSIKHDQRATDEYRRMRLNSSLNLNETSIPTLYIILLTFASLMCGLLQST